MLAILNSNCWVISALFLAQRILSSKMCLYRSVFNAYCVQSVFAMCVHILYNIYTFLVYLESGILSQTILCLFTILPMHYYTRFVYCHELAPGTVSLTGDWHGNGSKQYRYYLGKIVNKQRIVCDRIPGSRYKCILIMVLNQCLQSPL